MTNETEPFPKSGRNIHVAYESQWDGIVELLDNYGVRLFEIPPGQSVPQGGDVPTYGLMFKAEEP